MQEKLIFLPSTLPVYYVYEFSEPFEEIFLKTSDGAELNALHFKTENPKGVILYFHGNAGNLSRWGKITSYFTYFNYDVLVMDYRTYGKSTGKINEKKMFEDTQLFYNYLKERYKEEEIIVYGRSLGTSFASFVASRNNPKKLILETPFFNLYDVAKDRFPFLPMKYLLNFKFPSNEFIKDVTCPVVIFQGTDDSVVPYESAEKLSKLIPKKNLTFITVPGGTHNNLINFTEYTSAFPFQLKE